VEAQVDLVYNRNESTNMTVSVGSEITLNGQKYKITNLKQAGNSCEVTITDSKGNKKIIQ
jgi:fructose-specific component phosphotransferase system IIB-like protein